jgi:septum site-determining protein MinC
MENESHIQIKGIRDGLLVTAQTGTWSTRKEEIINLVNEKAAFFNGARVCLDVGDTLLRVTEITRIRDNLSDKGVILWAVLSQSEVTRNNASTLGLETKLQTKNDQKEKPEKEDAGERAVYINKTLRAGYKVETRDHVIIKGDVNPGAEIVSAGNIIIWGKLKGSAIAGAEGNSNSCICALELRPTQMRIGEFVFPPLSRKGKILPEVAYIENDGFKIEIWNREKG